MGLTLVQGVPATASAGANPSATVTAPTQGNFLGATLRTGAAEGGVAVQNGYTLIGVRDNSAVSSTGAIAWKIAGAGESTTQTPFSLTSGGESEMEWYEVNDSGGGTWQVDAGTFASDDDGGGGVMSIQPNPGTGLLAQAAEFVVAVAAQAATNGGSEAIDSGFTTQHAATFTRSVHGYIITAATTALNPSLSWFTARTASALIVAFRALAAGSTLNRIERSTMRGAMRGVMRGT